MHQIKLAPSVLSADLLKLEAQVREVEQNGADMIHVDVMDGQFVPNITFGPVIVKTLARITDLPLDVHLMINNADRYIDDFAAAGANLISVHQEALPHLHRAIQAIHDHKIKAGVVLNPATDVASILPILPEIEMVLIMSVNPGFGGQKFLNLAVDKIAELYRIRQEKDLDFMIEVDGGRNLKTTPLVVAAGADVLVAGNAIFGSKNIGQACREIKETAQNTRAKHG